MAKQSPGETLHIMYLNEKCIPFFFLFRQYSTALVFRRLICSWSVLFRTLSLLVTKMILTGNYPSVALGLQILGSRRRNRNLGWILTSVITIRVSLTLGGLIWSFQWAGHNIHGVAPNLAPCIPSMFCVNRKLDCATRDGNVFILADLWLKKTLFVSKGIKPFK